MLDFHPQMPALIDLEQGSIGRLVVGSRSTVATFFAPVPEGGFLDIRIRFWGRCLGNGLGTYRCSDGRRSTIHLREHTASPWIKINGIVQPLPMKLEFRCDRWTYHSSC